VDYRLFLPGISGLAPSAMRALEERQCLSVKPGQSHYGSLAFASREIVRDNLVLGDAVEVSIGAKA
jgi:hypothetical protein